jgi:anthranilate synthase/aminodeoxychorismate synthase-like glutamine amidotransferase
VVLLIDNYDSFVYNLARYVRELGDEAVVRRHDAVTVDEIAALAPTHIIISPGPCTPTEAGVSTTVVQELGATTPILGVCLGHQCIGAAFGGRIVRARQPMHGKVSPVVHDGTGIFVGLPSPLYTTRYHSLVIDAATIPDALRVTATSDDGEIMAVEHRDYPVIGVQFHPESALTEYGYSMLDAFLHGATGRADARRALADRADGRRSSLAGDRGADPDGPPLHLVPPPVGVVR